ncbi:hypothetical protein DFS34DRAFT_684138 [Phlyctochytrium arcticum]|nr:hypothetical protein DFS34DRAFT_684135 [Phlyctochytrium arcticum]KAI9100971.1 hypothetical protein DFS34DRAFT_684138 [Phlyctochytrium arcticum]
MRSVNDPFCVYTNINGTEVISYIGYLSKLDTAEEACNGINIRGLNIALVILGMLIGSRAIYGASGFLKNRKTSYNLVLLAAPILMNAGLVIELAGTASYFQFGGNPWLGHVPKFLYFAGVCGIAYMQGFRIEFILIGAGKPRRWKKYYNWAVTGIGILCGLTFTIFLLIGLTKGVDAQPFSFVYPYAFWLLFTAAVDTFLSIWILRITASQALLLSRYPELTSVSVGAFARQNNIAAVGQLIADVVLLGTYIIRNSVADMGYTFSYVSIFGLPLQLLMLIFSITVMQKARRAAATGQEYVGSMHNSKSAPPTSATATIANRSHPAGLDKWPHDKLNPGTTLTLHSLDTSTAPSAALKETDIEQAVQASRVN